MSRTVWIDKKDVPLLPWDLTISQSIASRARFVKALVSFKCEISDSFTFGPVAELRLRDFYMFRIWIPEGYEEKFRTLCKPQVLRTPPKVNLNLNMAGIPSV